MERCGLLQCQSTIGATCKKLQSGTELPAFGDPLAGVEGLEPPTPGFGDRCSSQLSYTPSGCLR
ncbi:hypothetical protein CHELA40_15103 [Chelatococcus asaccharovorans]|nr:hypothetical protein CHELA17_60518 [Chelatococcus asaccharovorans]CAH1681511.1 hypothetical protein CHELA40_15103 [Chelatococcus asaccharovorans]